MHCGKSFLFWLHVKKLWGLNVNTAHAASQQTNTYFFVLTITYSIYSSCPTSLCPISVPTDFRVTASNSSEGRGVLALLVCCWLVVLVQDFTPLKQKSTKVRATCSGKSLWDAILFWLSLTQVHSKVFPSFLFLISTMTVMTAPWFGFFFFLCMKFLAEI